MQDITFDRGIVRRIDTVLRVPGQLDETLLAGDYRGLVGAADAAEILETLLFSYRNVVLFAPTNQAFLNIGSAVEDLSADELSRILLYHLVAGEVVFSSGLQDGQELETVGGGTLTVTIEDDDDERRIFVNGVRVVSPDLLYAGGVIHGLDQ